VSDAGASSLGFGRAALFSAVYVRPSSAPYVIILGCAHARPRTTEQISMSLAEELAITAVNHDELVTLLTTSFPMGEC
jgi:hypothetical protein